VRAALLLAPVRLILLRRCSEHLMPLATMFIDTTSKLDGTLVVCCQLFAKKICCFGQRT
jgi:hypothetical protein